MAIGPVQLLVLGFSHPEFHGEIKAELEKLRTPEGIRFQGKRLVAVARKPAHH